MLTPIRRLRVTPKLRYAIALARRARQVAAECGDVAVLDRQLQQFAVDVLHQLDRQEATRARRLGALPSRARMAGIIEMRLRRKREA